jgi:RNA polymerase sigma factor (sigma-70 family)
MSTDDLELIRDYASEGSQAAFAELVNRHVDLVYSAARRQMRSPDLAAEVTQSVFIALARHGHKVKSDTPLTAWLYLVTRRTAIDCLRRETRRRVREHAAFEIADMKSTPSVWSQIEPLLDEAMETLTAADRSAILLRYFENQSLREVGRTLGTSEDAAQKRVSRALEQLRTFLSKSGVTVGATALAADLAAGAVQTAPIGLGLTISSAAAVSGAAGQLAAIEAIKTLAMTTTQKTLLGAAFAVLVGAGFYGQRLISQQQDEVRSLQEQAARLAAENRQLRHDREDDAQLLRAAQVAIDAARTKAAGDVRAGSGGDPAMEAELKAVSARMTVLKAKMAQSPDQQIPELRLLKDQDWINAAAKHKLETDDDLRAALRELRTSGTVNFANLMGPALWNYAQANEGQLPTDIMRLAPYFDPQVETEMLQRYGIVRAGKMRDVPQETTVIAEIAPDDANHDPTLYMSGPRNRIDQGNISLHSGSYSDISNTVLGAVADFIKAKNEQPLTEPAQLLPYLKAPVDPAKLREYWKAVGLPTDLHSPHD